jgi:hypothetical protein
VVPAPRDDLCHRRAELLALGRRQRRHKPAELGSDVGVERRRRPPPGLGDR